ncbi:uncharacterized protein LOC131687328 [Topomyia yanbarensis]|uniref:uncharacterized protein LOC131687328 n=1 Tax=Topomyia yanbarensis TaxID=2498891 RepID=UPI00273CCE8B|nr:uncharacterized protein LOC131687328 [Topomyia yanbarensis]
MLYGRPEIIVYSLMQKINQLPSPRADKLNSIVEFALAVRNMVATVQACNLEEHLYNISLQQSLVDRLPPMIKLTWATHRQNLQRVTLTEFSDWLYALAEAASIVTIPSVTSATDYNSRRGRKDDGFINAHSVTAPRSCESVSAECTICQGNCVSVDNCKEFLSLDHSSRWALLRNQKLCRCCLRFHRGLCKFSKSCGINDCPYKHHRLLHNDAKDKLSGSQLAQTQAITHDPSNISSNDFACNTHSGNRKSVLFKYIPVTLHNQGLSVSTHAFVDNGSSLTLLEETLAAELKLQGEKHPLCLRWTSDTCRYEDSATKITVDISGSHNPDSRYRLSDIYTVKELKLPAQSLSVEKLSEHHTYLKGIPVDSYIDVQPRILIGINNIRVVHPLDSREGNEHEPIATKTRLGWMIYGTSLKHNTASGYPSSYHVCSHSYGENLSKDDDLNTAVKNYFTLESLVVAKPERTLLSTADERALKSLRSTTSFNNGRYQTGLLWKYDDVRFPDSRSMEVRRHNCLMKRMQREPELASTLRTKMADYLKKGYIRKLTPDEYMMPKDHVWYLPIFPVFNLNKPGKVRIVWDAAATIGGVSLNSVLVKGPDMLTSLPSVLHKFRERRVAICGDIREMYHQVVINDSDQHCQRFIWCDDAETEKPSDYVMRVMTFGATCSPSSAQFIMNENASRFEQQHPIAVDVIRRRHYVDDMLASFDTEEEAIDVATNVRFIHQQGGFEMRNWMSNSLSVLKAVDGGPNPEKNLDINPDICFEKVLRMWWGTTNDVFRYKLPTDRNRELLFGEKRPTKREVLRTLMCIYDPLGLIANYTMFLKTLLQEIWRAGKGWDELIGDRELEKWNMWLRVLPQVKSVRVPRCYHPFNTNCNRRNIELHTFVDASETGFAAVSYFRFEEDDQIHCALVGAKTRVAPLKFVSIPRLELQAAVIGARLALNIQQNHTFQISRRFFWTDARDVMCWLNSDHRRYSQFVAFRVREILESTDISEWRGLSGKLNVADEATKWQRLPDLTNNSRWFNAPSFLWSAHNGWPVSSFNVEKTTEEIRLNLLHHSESPITDILQPENFSSWKHLVRLTAYVRRFPTNARRKQAGGIPVTGPLTRDEMAQAQRFHVKRAQEMSYGAEIKILMVTIGATVKKSLPKQSGLFKVCPFMDNDGVMRIHSRIDESDFAGKYTNYPIVLPRDHPVTKLILQEIHQRYHHQCQKTFINEVSRKYYIPRVHVVCWRI